MEYLGLLTSVERGAIGESIKTILESELISAEGNDDLCDEINNKILSLDALYFYD